jgi:hypothetical protein
MRSYRLLLLAIFSVSVLYSVFASSYADDAGLGAAPPSGLSIQKLLTITSDKNSKVDDLDVALDTSGAPQGMEVVLEGQSDASPLFFALSDISSDAGVVLNQTSGYNTLVLKGSVSPAPGSSTLTLSYLSNALSGDYVNCDVIVNQSDDGVWSVENAYNHEAVQTIHVTSWAFGVSTIDGICPTN